MMKCTFLVVAFLVIFSVAGAVDAQPPRGGRGPQRGAPGAGRGRGNRMPSFPLLEALDADRDGKLSSSEVENAVAALKKLDKDGDGTLSQAEIGWPPEPPGFAGRSGAGRRGGFGSPGGGVGMVERIMANDKNDDGKVTRDELPQFMQRLLDRADTNEDGAIDREEATAVSEAIGRGAPGRGAPGRGAPGRGGFGRGGAGRGG